MVRSFLLLTFLAASAVAGENDAATRIAAVEARIGGRIGVAALDTGNTKHVEHRADERFPMCSTFKFLAAAAVMKRVDEKKEKLERFVPYGAKEILEYAPVTKEHLKDGGMTLGALCAAAIEQSDNTAGNLLLDAIGGPSGLTNFVRSLGDRLTRLDRIEPELNSAIPGDERDTTTPAAICSDIQRLLLGDALSEASRRQLEDWLQRNETGGPMIRAGVPKNWILGDKTGRGSNGATNDIAIMRPPDRAPILLAIYSVGSTATPTDRAAAVAEVAESFVSAAQNIATATSDYQTTFHPFDYDAKAPLDIHDKIIEEFDGGNLHDITYVSPKGGPVAAYLVVPKGKGPFAAVLFGHWGNGTRTEFIPEAKLYARAGAVSLLPDYPWDRPQPWHKTPNHYDKPELDREIEIQAVLELRRGIDLLLARPDVDPKRLAYVGHSYGAQWGSILSAVDKRMKTSVLMAGVAEIGDIFLRGNDPGIIELRKSRPPGQFERYAQIAGEIDALHFVGHAAPIPLLFQFANFEQLFDKTSMEHYATTATDPKKVLYYDAGHDLNDPQALQDRYDWLAKYIDLRRLPIVSSSAPQVQAP